MTREEKAAWRDYAKDLRARGLKQEAKDVLAMIKAETQKEQR